MAPRVLAAVAALAALVSSATALYINGSVIASCDSLIFCQGELLKAVQLAAPYDDSKTFVDMPTIKPIDEVIAAFNQLSQPITNNTELNSFLDANFGPVGYDIDALNETQLQTNATFLNKINDTVIHQFTEAVINIWPDLTRQTNDSKSCNGCVSSFIPVKRPFVVAGGRFREPYYWDSYWIIEGLLRTGGSFTGIALNIIENFLDFVETIGFVPNGARQYYLNRSQPPLLTEMVRAYVEYTKDTSILERAVPLLIKEHDFWVTNRSVSITAANGKTYTLQRYHVNNNQPRPESYLEDYVTANNQSYYSTSGKIYNETVPLNETEIENLYANLATGAESGWDYGSRYIGRPSDALNDVFFPLRYLNVRELVTVDLNSILYLNEVTIAAFLKMAGNETGAKSFAKMAEARSEAMYTLMWNETLWSYFDYNLTSNSQYTFIPVDPDATAAEEAQAPKGDQVLFDVAQLYPFWTGAAPDQLKSNPLAVEKAYSRVATMLDENVGGIPATNFLTGQQWDEPNVWPSLQHILMQGLLNTPATFGEDDPSYVGLQALSLKLGQRYLDSTFCTWLATGGSTTETPQLPGFNSNSSYTGIMFEKYVDSSTNLPGGGGEYTVVAGFGWSNGVLIWTVDTFGNKLKRPNCGNVTAAFPNGNANAKRSIGRRESRGMFGRN